SVEARLQRVFHRTIRLEQELVLYRDHLKDLSPASPLLSDITLSSPILTPPVDALSTPVPTPSRWNGASWEFLNDTATHSSVQQYDRTQQPSPSLDRNPTPLPTNSSLSLQASSHAQARSNHTQQPIGSSSSLTSFPAHAASTATLPLHPLRDRNGFAPAPVFAPASSPVSPYPSSVTATTTATTTATATTVVTAMRGVDSSVPLQFVNRNNNNNNNNNESSIPCADCIHHCALAAAAVVRGDLDIRISCTNLACRQSPLIVSVNEMAQRLKNFAQEVIQVTAQGVEGKLGVQAKMENEHGMWKEFVSHLNTMTVSHSEQVRDIASVCTAVAHGDLSQKITVAVKGETLVLKNTINTMVDQLRSFSSEVTRVAHEVGTEGRLGGQAHVKGVDGTWKELTDNVNTMAANLTAQVRDIANVSKAVAMGDLTKKISVEVKGEMLDLKNTFNIMVDQLQQFATEVTRVSLEVGTEGKLGGQALVKDVSGTWKELTDNVNLMAANLTNQVRDIAQVCKAVASGDLTQKVRVPVQGEILELKETMNTMVDQLRTFAAEVTRVAREVGTEGRLGGQAEVEGVDGTWKELTDNVNTMAANLTAQVRDIATVSKAVAKGDLTKKISVDVMGEMMDLKNTFNIMVDQLQEFATEVTRVSLEVGTMGKLGGQAVVKDVSGTWKVLTDNVNTMASNLTTQVRSIAEVTTAVAAGDLSKTIEVEAQGEIFELKKTVNKMVEQLRTFAAEVTRVSREVGTEGKLGGQAHVKDVDGTWKELTDNVNTMAANLTAQVRDIANVSKAVARGDLSKKISVDVKGEMLDLKNTFNIMVDQLQEFATEVTRVSLE
ncbi:hypothetical protein BGW38_006394, partial [Lunasporangiospora selenospora]